jgi:P27 family predicted phage terminase small subunit
MRKLSVEAQQIKDGLLAEYDISDTGGLAILQRGLEAFDDMRKAQRVIDKQGMTFLGERGQIKAHPLLTVVRDCRAQFLAALKQLNLDIEPLHDKPGRPPGRR